jgi:hypothetical protein
MSAGPGVGFRGGEANKPVFAYTRIGVKVIQAMSKMAIEEAQRDLYSLSRSRPDLAGLVAIALYPKDPHRAVRMMKQAIRDTKPKSSQTQSTSVNDEPAKMALAFLMTQPSPESADAVADAIVDGSASVSDMGIAVLAGWMEAKVPAEKIDLNKTLKASLTGLTKEINHTQKAQALDKMIVLAEKHADPDLRKIIDAAIKAKERRAKIEAAGKQRSSGASRRSGTRR